MTAKSLSGAPITGAGFTSGGLTIGEVEKVTGLKAHILRYWEQEVPMIQPRRDKAGRHVYSKRDIQLIFRLKHLLYEKRYTIAGARHQIFLEISGARQDVYSQISLLRAELLTILAKTHSLGEKLSLHTQGTSA
jgi:DNA-binding transcriptional MerR regulator